MKIGAVVFDMDGLMLDTERLARIAWDQAMAEWGHTIPDEVYFRLIGRSVADVGEILRQALAADLPFEEIARRKRQYVDREIAEHGIPVKPGLHELLDWVDQAGLKKATATSTFREVALQKLRLVGLQDRFDAIVCGDDIQRGKPAPDIFLAAARKLAIPAGECVVLEDSEPGIEAAQSAGMVPLMVPDIKPPSEEATARAYRVFSSLGQVKTFLAQSIEP
jgi:HAD superfamily hydrolase (TIGR01509 family)